jgi:hypothetical protein
MAVAAGFRVSTSSASNLFVTESAPVTEESIRWIVVRGGASLAMSER